MFIFQPFLAIQTWQKSEIMSEKSEKSTFIKFCAIVYRWMHILEITFKICNQRYTITQNLIKLNFQIFRSLFRFLPYFNSQEWLKNGHLKKKKKTTTGFTPQRRQNAVN